MPWIRTFTGVKFDVENPAIDDLSIEDIAHALAHQCRFGGHCRKFYSVAEHSCHVGAMAGKKFGLGLAGLMHDGSEAYLVDIPRPIKHLFRMHEYRELEAKLQEKIYQKFVPYFTPNIYTPDTMEEIKLCDNAMLAIEIYQLMPNPREYSVELPAKPFALPCWSPEDAEKEFLNAYFKSIE